MIKIAKTLIFIFGILMVTGKVIAQTDFVVSDDSRYYVRPYKKKDANKVIKLLEGEKKKAEKVNNKLKSKVKDPHTSLSALEQSVVEKTDQRIDSLTKAINEINAKNIKGSDRVVGLGKSSKNVKIKKGEAEVLSKLMETEEAKKLKGKLKKSDIRVDSSFITDNKYLAEGIKIYHFKDLSADTLQEVLNNSIKNRAVSEVKERGAAEAFKVKEVGEANEVFQELKGLKTDSASADKIAETIVQKTEYGKDLAQLNRSKDALSQAGEQTRAIDNEMKAMQDEAKAIQDQEQMQRYAREKISKLANTELGEFAPQIKQVQQRFTQYKKKMEWLKEGSGGQANSLKDEPIGRRFVYGGNFQIAEIDPFSIVVAPFVGYRINKKFTSGVSFSYKAVIGKNDLKTRSFGGEKGYRVYTDYKLIKNWFAHGEFERLSKEVKNNDKEGTHTSWTSNGYIGAGREINLAKGWKMNVMFLVNILHKDLSHIDSDAFQFRFGINK